MKCIRCGHENKEGRKFCVRCGALTAGVCPKCGAETEEGAGFCGECGAGLAAGPAPEPIQPIAAAGGERKQATVMFADLSGYTALSEKLDPEEVKDLMSLLFGEVAQIVARYEGIIEKFIGDAVMALFGVPRAHEDDPARAVKAALEIHAAARRLSPKVEARLGRRLCMHTGINTGLVVTGKAHDGEGAHGVTGDTVNLASRLSGLAKSDEIVIGAATAQQARRFFELIELAPMNLKGKAEPIKAFRVTGPRERPAGSHPLDLRSALIGRGPELAALREGWERLQRGEGTIITVIGELGVGKSRLIEEFRAGLPKENLWWREGFAHAFSQNVSYAPVMDLLRRAWGLKEEDDEDAVKTKLASSVQALIPDGEPKFRYLARLFGIDFPELAFLNPETWKNRFYDAMQELLIGVARRGPAVIRLEDLQWSDPATVDLLRFLLSGYQFTYPVLFILSHRPGFQLFGPHRPGLPPDKYREILLPELDPAQSQRLLCDLLNSPDLPTELSSFVRQRAGGNPFYLEEVVNSLVETALIEPADGTWKITGEIVKADLPATIQGVISARLDRLPYEHKRLTQEAAVIGRSFSLALLTEVSAAGDRIISCLSDLAQWDLIQSRSQGEDREYLFKHALTQEVAYGSLLIKDRQELHKRAGRGLEGLFADEKEKYCELIAYHFGRGKDREKEIAYSIMAGEKNQKANAVFTATEFYSRADELLKAAPDDPDQVKRRMLVLEKLWLNTLAADFKKCFETVKELLAIYEGLGLREGAILGKARLMWSLSAMGRVNDSQTLYREIEAELAPGSLAAAAARVCLAEALRLQGDYRRLDVFYETRPALAKVNPAILSGNLALTIGGLAFSGQIVKAWQEFEESMAYAEQNDLVAIKIGCLIHALAICLFDGQYARVPGLLTRIDQVMTRIGGGGPEPIFPVYGGHLILIMIYADLGDVPGMTVNLERLCQSLDRAGFEPGQAELIQGFGRGLVLAEQGEFDPAIAELKKSVDGLRATLDCCFYLPHALNALGRAYYRTGNFTAAKACHAEALAFSKEREDRPSEVYARRMLGLLLAEDGRFSEAEAELRRALQMARDFGLRPSAAWALEALGRVYEKNDHHELARQYYSQARDEWAAMDNPRQKNRSE